MKSKIREKKEIIIKLEKEIEKLQIMLDKGNINIEKIKELNYDIDMDKEYIKNLKENINLWLTLQLIEKKEKYDKKPEIFMNGNILN